jgi:hypothetical protein
MALEVDTYAPRWRQLSAGTRRAYINYIVNKHLALNEAPYWDWENPTPEMLAYREWKIEQEPLLRAELEAMTDDELRTEYDRCCNPRNWEISDFSSKQFEQHERWEEIERERQSRRSMAQKGGLKHRSTKQSEIIEACKDMRARDPKIKAKEAYKRLLNTGHHLQDGRIIRFGKKPLALATFTSRYWPKQKCCSC